MYLYMLTPDGRAQAFRVTSFSWLTSSEIFCTKCLTSGSANCVTRLLRLWQGTVENLRVYCDGCSGFVLAGFVEVYCPIFTLNGTIKQRNHQSKYAPRTSIYTYLHLIVKRAGTSHFRSNLHIQFLAFLQIWPKNSSFFFSCGVTLLMT